MSWIEMKIMNNIKTIICSIFFLLGLIFQSCVNRTEYSPTDEAWIIHNSLKSELILYTVYADGLSPVEYVPAILGMPAEYYVRVYCESFIRDKLPKSPAVRIYFVLPTEDSDIKDIPTNISHGIACITLDATWMTDHNYEISFPEDCTVNPDLWKIYDLDKFVKRYGPLNAQGWDEVWQKWEQAKAERGGS